MSLIIPPNTRAVGTPDPANDMDNVSDVLGVVVQALSRLTQPAGSVPAPHSGDAANITATQNLAAGKAVYAVPGTVAAVVTGSESVVVGAPSLNTANVVVITDDPANARSGPASMLVIQSSANAQLFAVSATGAVSAAGAIQSGGLGAITASGPLVSQLGNLDIQQAGKGLQVAEGANAKQGIATLAAGTVTVANTSVTANSRIFVTCQILGTVTVASAFDTPRVAGTSFTIHASQATDTSTVAWEIFEPG